MVRNASPATSAVSIAWHSSLRQMVQVRGIGVSPRTRAEAQNEDGSYGLRVDNDL
jgi:hypothetical protein